MNMPDTFEQLARTFRTQLAVAEKDGAYQQYNAGSLKLTLSQIRERAAELHSQSFESLNKHFPSIGPLSDEQREIALTFVRYAVNGRI